MLERKVVVVAGGRDFADADQLYAVLNTVSQMTVDLGMVLRIVSGGARGADQLGERWAREAGVPCSVYPARWDELGRRAGHVRNREMAYVGDHLVAFWDGKSSGTRNMIQTANELGLTVEIHAYEIPFVVIPPKVVGI